MKHPFSALDLLRIADPGHRYSLACAVLSLK